MILETFLILAALPFVGLTLFFGSKGGYYDSDDYQGDGCSLCEAMNERIFLIFAILTITIPNVFILMNIKDLFNKPIQIEVIIPSKIRVGL